MLLAKWSTALLALARSCRGGYRDNTKAIDLNEPAEMSDEDVSLPPTEMSEEQHQRGWYDLWGAWHNYDYPSSSTYHQALGMNPDTISHYGVSSSRHEIHGWRYAFPHTYRHQAVEQSAWQQEYHHHHVTPGQGEHVNEEDTHREEEGEEVKEEEEGENAIFHDEDEGENVVQVVVPPRLSIVRQSYLQNRDGNVVLMEPPMTPSQIQSLLDREWERRGLKYAMGPRKLAMAISEIKLEYGYDAQIGQAASKKIRLDSAMGRVEDIDDGSEYLGEFITWQNKMTRKIIALRKTYAVDHKNFANDEERARAVYVNFRNLHEKSYDGNRLSQDAYSLKAMQEVEEKMKSVWKAFMEERIRPALGSQVDEHRLPLELIEFYSRDFRYKDQRRQATTECIKRYMMQVLKRDPKDKNRFTSLRNRWRQEQHSLSRQKPKGGGRSES